MQVHVGKLEWPEPTGEISVAIDGDGVSSGFSCRIVHDAAGDTLELHEINGATIHIHGLDRHLEFIAQAEFTACSLTNNRVALLVETEHITGQFSKPDESFAFVLTELYVDAPRGQTTDDALERLSDAR